MTPYVRFTLEIHVLLLARRLEMEAQFTVRRLWNDGGVKTVEATFTCGGLMKIGSFFWSFSQIRFCPVMFLGAL